MLKVRNNSNLLRPPSITGSYQALNQRFINELKPPKINTELKSHSLTDETVEEVFMIKPKYKTSSTSMLPPKDDIERKPFKSNVSLDNKSMNYNFHSSLDHGSRDMNLNNADVGYAIAGYGNQLRRRESFVRAINRIRNDTRDLGNRNTLNGRRQSMFSNNQIYQQILDHPNAFESYQNLLNKRHVSSLEQMLQKKSNVASANTLNGSDSRKSSVRTANSGDGSGGEINCQTKPKNKYQIILERFTEEREMYSLYVFSETNK